MVVRIASGFGVLALLLAAIGLYGVMTYAITRRTAEIGLRVALGAEARDVVRLVMLDAFRLVGSGLVVGVPLAFAATRLLEAQLHGTSAADPSAFLVAGTILVSSAAIAAFLPARRASRVAPLVALRQE